jgi:hypothetical protein
MRGTLALGLIGLATVVGFAVWGVVTGEIWRVGVLDLIAVVLLMASGLIIGTLILGRMSGKTSETLNGSMANWATAIVGVAAVFLAYGSFRNQTRLAVEAQLSQESEHLQAMEMADPNLRCLYDNYGNPNYGECLAIAVKDSASWSKVMFYVEESWFVLEKSAEDRTNWGSKFAEDLKYWAEDVSKDPTGIFTYQLVSTEGGVDEARKVMRKAGVCIPDICQRYNLVYDRLAKKGLNKNLSNICQSTEHSMSRVRCP